MTEVNALKPINDIHDVLNPIYETVRILSKELPKETTLIGFAGAPWTVATYMIAGRGTPEQKPAHDLKNTNTLAFDTLIEILTKATIEYLSAQIDAGAEVVKIFDSWADKYSIVALVKISIRVSKAKVLVSLRSCAGF
jgi:uroporphyrinogen decarboxylase